MNKTFAIFKLTRCVFRDDPSQISKLSFFIQKEDGSLISLDLRKEINDGYLEYITQVSSLKLERFKDHRLDLYRVNSYAMMTSGVEILKNKVNSEKFPVYFIIDTEPIYPYHQSILESGGYLSAMRESKLQILFE